MHIEVAHCHCCIPADGGRQKLFDGFVIFVIVLVCLTNTSSVA